MTPKLDRSFYRLDPEQRLLYLTGMPRELCMAADVPMPQFAPTRLPTSILTAQIQSQKFQEIRDSFPPDSLTVISSNGNDREARQAASYLVKNWIKKVTRAIEFVHPTESITWDADRLKDLYVLTGIHENDPKIVHDVRRWVRTSLGVPRVLIVTTAEPYRWCAEQLGCLPDFIFHVRHSGQSVG